MRVCVRMCERERVCVYVCEGMRDRVCVSERERDESQCTLSLSLSHSLVLSFPSFQPIITANETLSWARLKGRLKKAKQQQN